MRRVVANPIALAMQSAAKLKPAEVARQIGIVRHSLERLMRAELPDASWCDMADAANIAETLAGMGIGSGPEADAAITAAQRVLSDVYARHVERGTWAMRSEEIEALRLLIALHEVQLEACSFGEFDRAFRKTAERVRQALAGNAPADAIVVDGRIGAAA
jgi:hypothetical protein